jgi:hypothetical protein
MGYGMGGTCSNMETRERTSYECVVGKLMHTWGNSIKIDRKQGVKIWI